MAADDAVEVDVQSRNFVSAMLTLLFFSSMGESYFPDMMNIIGLQARTNWMFVADALGNICGVFVPTKQAWSEVPAAKAIVPALCDMVSKVFLLGGIALSSAQTKSILYNSCIVWSALLSRFILGRSLTVGQWLGVFTLIGGLLIKIDFKGNQEANNLFLGMVSILIGCAVHSLTNVINEYYIRKFGIVPSKLCCLIGCCSMTVWTLLFAVGFIIPELVKVDGKDHWLTRRADFFPSEGTLWDELAKSHEDLLWTNLSAWCGFVISSGLHAVAYYFLLGSIGNVSCGVMKGLTTAGYVTLSALVLCGPGVMGKYCLTWATAMSSCVVVLGVLTYTWATQKAAEEARILALPAVVAQESSAARPLTSDAGCAGVGAEASQGEVEMPLAGSRASEQV